MNVSNITPVSSGANLPAQSVDAGVGVNEATNVGNSEASENKDMTRPAEKNVDEPGSMHSPEPLKSMSTSDFLTLHNSNYEPENMMDKLLKMFETIIALKILEDTLESTKKANNEHGFKGIA